MNRNNDNGEQLSLWREALFAMTIGWDLAIPIVGGVIVGYFVDRWLGTRYIFTLGLLTLGVTISFYNLARLIQRQDRQSRQEEKKKDHQDDQKG